MLRSVDELINSPQSPKYSNSTDKPNCFFHWPNYKMDPILVETDGWKTNTVTTLDLEHSEQRLLGSQPTGNEMLTRHLGTLFDTLRCVSESFESDNLAAKILAPRILQTQGKARRLPSVSGHSARLVTGTACRVIKTRYEEGDSDTTKTVVFVSGNESKDGRTSINESSEVEVGHEGAGKQMNLVRFGESRATRPDSSPLRQRKVDRDIYLRHRQAKRGLLPGSIDSSLAKDSTDSPSKQLDNVESAEKHQPISVMMEDDLGLNQAGYQNMLQELHPVGNPGPKKQKEATISVFKRLKRLVNEDSNRICPTKARIFRTDYSVDSRQNQTFRNRDLKSWSLENTSLPTEMVDSRLEKKSNTDKQESLGLQIKKASAFMKQKTNSSKRVDRSSTDTWKGEFKLLSRPVSLSRDTTVRRQSQETVPRVPLEAITQHRDTLIKPKAVVTEGSSSLVTLSIVEVRHNLLGDMARGTRVEQTYSGNGREYAVGNQSNAQRSLLREAAQEYRRKYKRIEDRRGVVLEPSAQDWKFYQPQGSEAKHAVARRTMQEVREILSKTNCNTRLKYDFT